MRYLFILSVICCFTFSAGAQELKEIKLKQPNKERGASLMKALEERKSIREYADKKVDLQDLSDLLWAANGINREDGRRTAPTARNKQDIELYVCLEEGSYFYDAKENSLKPVAKGDLRPALAGQQDFAKHAPAIILIVSDIARFEMDKEKSMVWGAMSAGYVSQNINLFCSANKMATVPRAFMDKEKVSQGLKLKENQIPMLNHPVGYQK